MAAGNLRELLLKPVALAPSPGGRQVVGEVSAAAEAFAVRPGLPLGEAFARCPELKLVAPDPAAARTGWEQVIAGLEQIGAEVEASPDRPGTAYFEAAGLERLHGGLPGVLAAARAAVERPLRLGVAQTRFVALLAARSSRPRKARMITTDLARREFLSKAPVDWLRQHEGLDDLAAILQKLGIETLGEFAVLRRAEVAERFGADGLTARDLVFGQEPPLRPRHPAEQLSERIDLQDETGQGGAMAADLEHALMLLLERLLARPERKQRTLRGITLSARFAEGGSWAIRAIMREPTADPERIKLAVERKLLELPEPAASLAVTVDGFGPLDHTSETLFGKDSERERARRLEDATEQARQAAGSPQSVARIVTLDESSRLPERRATLSPGPVPLSKPRPIEPRLDEDGRPLALPRARGAAARRLRLPRDRRTATRDAPEQIPVAHERERWVVEDRWWTGRPVRRHYFELVMADGSNVVLFKDMASGRWFEQRA